MNTITHALAPVILVRLIAGRRDSWKRRHWMSIGLAGALPDLINPHLSLEARMNSWSHGLPAWAAFTALAFTVALASRGRVPPWLAAVWSAAYLFHLFCDAISGGIDWLHPLGSFVWGDYWVSPIFWFPLDFILLLVLYFLFRWVSLRQRSKHQYPEIQS